jgi:hypothetical protein
MRDLYFSVTFGVSHRLDCMIFSITSSDMRVFQSSGVGGIAAARRAILICASSGVCEREFSLVMIAFQSLSDILLSQVLTSAILVVGASKKFGYRSSALHHFAVRNSTDRTISIAIDGVAQLASAAVSSS